MTRLVASSVNASLQMTFNGVFATHQHHLFCPTLQLFPTHNATRPLLKRTHLWRMGTRPLELSDMPKDSVLTMYSVVTGQKVVAPTYTVEEGIDTSSLAFQVAAEQVFALQDSGLRVFIVPRAPCSTACLHREPS
jgi:hypothetical protein